MNSHVTQAVAKPPPTVVATANLPPVATTVTQTATKTSDPANWHRVTIRLPIGELAKINDLVIATQQANRSSKVTTTDILRAGLRRLKDQEAISVAEIHAIHSVYVKGKTVRPS